MEKISPAHLKQIISKLSYKLTNSMENLARISESKILPNKQKDA